eukprot:CAMPEP_0184693446 /NCGR_PEP_ID=MMETSP0313-20130426/1668_1 /TAXON_ID=2792 /ORGANISM="Porphyridium aerugineum, Strain SAG 1380-2" /LENGTH=630 /DNA_ID=CAMNT_0027151529 /DNA_START=650 /DNA_END=2542 /DNA_ORIENTATION=+
MEFTHYNNPSCTDGSAGAFQQLANQGTVDPTHSQQQLQPGQQQEQAWQQQQHQQFASSYKYQPSNNYVMHQQHQQHQQSMPNTPATWSRNNSSLQSIQEIPGGNHRSASGPYPSMPPQMEQPTSTTRTMFPPPVMPLQQLQQQHHAQHPWSVMHLPSLSQNGLSLMQQQQLQQQQQHQAPKLTSSAMSSLHNTPLGSTRELSAEKMKLDFILNREDSGGGGGSGSGSFNMNTSMLPWQAGTPAQQQQQPPMFYPPVPQQYQQRFEHQPQQPQLQQQQYMPPLPTNMPNTNNMTRMINNPPYNLVDVNPSSLKTTPQKGVEELKREMESRVQTVRRRAATPLSVKEEDASFQQQRPHQREQREEKEQEEQQDEASSTPTSNMLTHSNSTNMQRKRKLVKNFWTEEEDEQLLQLVGVHGAKNWNKIAADHMPHRRGSQLRSRYIYVLSAQDSQPAPFTEEEDLFILDAYKKHGPKWSLMASTLNNNRKDQEVKHRFRKLQRSINRSKKYGGNAPGSLGVIGRLMDSKGELDWSRVEGASGMNRMASIDDSGVVPSGANSIAGPSRKNSGSMADLGTDDYDEGEEGDEDVDDDESLEENDNSARPHNHQPQGTNDANGEDTEQQDNSNNDMMM